MTQGYQVVYVIFIDFTLSLAFVSLKIGSHRILTRPQVKTAGTRNINAGWENMPVSFEAMWALCPCLESVFSRLQLRSLLGFCEDEGVTNFNLRA